MLIKDWLFKNGYQKKLSNKLLFENSVIPHGQITKQILVAIKNTKNSTKLHKKTRGET